jgi:murein DD-endopeptidase MepM/ murein hydrolase activator NlpD
MSRILTRTALAATLFCTAACTQTPVQVEMKGHQVFLKSGEYTDYAASDTGSRSAPKSEASYQAYAPAPVYANTRPVSRETQQTAGISSIGVSDLTPPAKAAPAEKTIAKESPKPAPVVQTASVNPWTKKPRSDDEQVASVVTAKENRIVVEKASHSAGFVWPVNGRKVVSGFGPKGRGKANDGINIASNEGEPVWAAADGEVVYVGNELSGYGNMVLIKHGGGKTSSYAHMSRASVDKYDRVKQGDIIGYVGSTGNVKSPQLHFAIRDGKDPVDPRKYLSSSVAGL